MCIGKENSVIFVLKDSKTMAKFVLEVDIKKGKTICEECPFFTDNACCKIRTEHIDCDKYDLSTIKIERNIGEIKLKFQIYEVSSNNVRTIHLWYNGNI